MMKKIQAHMFWAYGDLSKLETICCNSFVNNNYQLNLWTYGQMTNAPSGVCVRDAREILPESLIFLNSKGSYAGFSDFFRYAVLNKQGGLYSDTDVIALKPASELPQKAFLVTENCDDRVNIKINGNIIYNPEPKTGNIVDLALAYTERFPKQDVTWSEIGPDLLTAIATIYPKHGFQIMQPSFANPINFWDCPASLLGAPVALPEDAMFLHCYNEMWRRANIDKNAAYPENSLVQILANKYL
jgi:hypothetical protein